MSKRESALDRSERSLVKTLDHPDWGDQTSELSPDDLLRIDRARDRALEIVFPSNLARLVAVSLTPRDQERLDAAARKAGMSRSAFVRALLAEHENQSETPQ